MHSFLSRNKYTALFIVLIVLENFILFFYSVNKGQQWLNAFCYFITSLLIGFLLLWKFKGKQAERIRPEPANPRIWVPVAAVSAGILVFFAVVNSRLFHNVPIDPRSSDIIPTIQVLVRRLLHGAWVYRPIEEFGYHLPVTYLPLQWIVFTPAAYWGFDFRWIPFIIWTAAGIVLVVRVFKVRNIFYQFLIPAFLLGIYGLILCRSDSIVSATVETMVAGYYILLIVSLNQKNALLQGIGITLCLLSRFSLVLWLPLWAFVLFASGNRKYLYVTVTTAVVLVALIYVVPFLQKDWHSFFAGYEHYSLAALGEWRSINYTIMKPYQLNTGVGIAYLFADTFHDNLPLGLKLLQRLHLAFCLLTVLLLGLWYWKNRGKIPYAVFLLASFKIYLTVFLFFIQVPYIYLMAVANFISVAILAEQMRYRIIPSGA